MAGAEPSFYEVLTAAVADLEEHGYDSEERVARWKEELRRAADRAIGSGADLERLIRQSQTEIYRRLLARGALERTHRGVARFTLQLVEPRLRAELDRRIRASASLIKLNREAAIRETLQRFEGFATSVPPGGSEAVDRRQVKAGVARSLKSLPFRERRVLIDQGHKLRANLADVVARGGGAIAARWHSHWKETGYDYRPAHKQRDEKVYLLRDSWAKEKGLVKPGKDGYAEDITQPGEEVYCRCYFTYIFNLRDLPPEMLTKRGREELARVRAT